MSAGKRARWVILSIGIVSFYYSAEPLHGTFSYPVRESKSLRTRCIGYNNRAVAARRFLEGNKVWETRASSMDPIRHRVAVILAEFPEDTDSLTTGNGTFGVLPFFQPHPDSALAAQGYVVRDSTIKSRSKAYYQRHLIWMAQYFSAVSNGLLTIEEPDTLVDITPIIQLPEEMGYYGDNDLFGPRQTEFVRDAIVAADTLSDIDFSNYDAVMVFHAGAGEESDFGPPPSYPGDTPNDLFSSYIPFEALRAYIGDGAPDYRGVATIESDGDTFYVQNAIIIPETIIQDSSYNPSAVYLDILGIMAHEYGHELGLPDLNDTDTGTRPAVANFGLMSSGLFNSSGRLPAHPIAWCKLFLGWESAQSITVDTVGVELKGIEQPGEGTKLIRVPISSSEYFLLENRLRDSNFDGDFLFDDTDGDNWPDLMEDDYQLEDGTYSEFDFGLPGIATPKPGTNEAYDEPLLGSGVLIWHIDDEVIRNNFNPQYTENCVNCNVFHQGIDLEEADGIQHGDEILPATIDPGYGSPFDSYGGMVPGIKDEPNTVFSESTTPASNSYVSGATGITIQGFRSLTRGDQDDVLVDSLVAVDVLFSKSVPGWPVVVVEPDSFDFTLNPAIFGGNGICTADIDGDGDVEISIVTKTGDIFILNADGTNFIGGYRDIQPVYSLGASVKGTPAMGDLTGDGAMEIVVVSEDGDLYALSWSSTMPPFSVIVLDGFPVDLGDQVTSSPLLLDLDSPPDGIIERIVVGTDPESGSDGKLFSIPTDGSVEAGWSVPVSGSVKATPAAGDLGRTGDIDIVVATSSGFIYRIDSDGSIEWTHTVNGESFAVSPSLGDIDRDGDRDRDGVAERLGDLEIVIGSLSGRIYILTSSGQDFATEPLETGGTIRVPISLGDIDKDGFTEIIALVDSERKISVYRTNTSGSSINLVNHFPKYVSSSVSGDFFSHPLLADLDGDDQEEIVFGTGNNVLYAYDLSSSMTPSMRFPLGAKGLSTPFIGKSAGDTLAIFAADERGMLYGWQLDTLLVDAVSISWAQEGRDNLHSYANGDSLGESEGQPLAFDKETFTIFPNPAPGRNGTKQVNVTYSLDETISELSLDIYTVSGRHYKKITPPSPSFLQPDARHILQWNITDVPSGIYILRLAIEKPDGSRDHLIKKAAIVK